MEEIKEDNKNLSEEAKWYVLHTISGYDNIAKQNLELAVSKFGLENRIFSIVIPTIDVESEKKGKKVWVEEKKMPSYIFIKMIYGDDIWHLITRTRGVTGFVGPKGRPLPLTREEIDRLGLDGQKKNIEVNNLVRVLGNEYESGTGTVQSVDLENKTCKVMFKLFDGEASVELEVNLDQVRKIEKF